MAERPITRFVDVQIIKDTPLVSAAGFGILLVLTNSEFLSFTTRVKEFSTVESVEDFFDEGSEESLAADAYFNQDPNLEYKPETILFGRYANNPTSALLEGGANPLADYTEWQAITDGSFEITIDGVTIQATALNFSGVSSMDDVAGVITFAFEGAGTCRFRNGIFIFKSATTGLTSTITLCSSIPESGTDISGLNFLDCDVLISGENPEGSTLTQGGNGETAETAIEAIENVNNDWYALSAIKDFRDSDDVEDIADQIESRRKIFIIATNDSNILTLGDTTSNSYYVKNANYKRTGFIYHDNEDVYIDTSWLGQQLPKPIGSTNWAYKTLAGIAEGAAVNIDPVNLTQAQIDAALDLNCNLYTSVLASDYTYFGTMGGGRNIDKDGEYIDIIRNIDFLQARIEEGLLSLFLERDIIPYTDGGITIIETRVRNRLQVYGADQKILIGSTIQTSFPKRADTSAENRDDRQISGTFQAELSGAIDNVIVRGIVYV